jgi:hypothetical protein
MLEHQSRWQQEVVRRFRLLLHLLRLFLRHRELRLLQVLLLQFHPY